MLIKNPQKCPLCRQHWLFDTNQIGELIARHPPGKCTPPIPASVYEKEDAEDDSDFVERICDECHKKFKPKKKAKCQTICGPECREARRARKHLARKSPDWKPRAMAALELATRICTECDKPFTISSKFSVKQLCCSAKCRRDRDSRRHKRAA